MSPEVVSCALNNPRHEAEFIAMRLARKAGLNVASVALRTAMGKDVLVIERFDRVTQMIMRVTMLRFGTEISCP